MHRDRPLDFTIVDIPLYVSCIQLETRKQDFLFMEIYFSCHLFSFNPDLFGLGKWDCGSREDDRDVILLFYFVKLNESLP